ncbi:MAG: hypothetical protein NTAFB01_03380 [Nitrospira sp.]
MIGTIRQGSKAELFLGMLFLRGLINKIPHVLFEETNDMAGKDDWLCHALLSSFFMEGARSAEFIERMMQGSEGGYW